MLLAAGTARADTLSVSIGSADGAPGSEITIPVSVTDAKDLGAFQAEMEFDPSVLELEGIHAGPLLEDALLDSNVARPGKVKIGFVKLAGVNGSGVLFNARFAVTGKSGTSSSVSLQEIGAWEQSSHREIRVSPDPGSITVAGNVLPLSLPTLIGAGVAILLVLIIVIRLMRRRKPESPKSPQRIEPNIKEDSAGAPAHVFCTECGAKLSPGAKFCPECGTKTGSS